MKIEDLKDENIKAVKDTTDGKIYTKKGDRGSTTFANGNIVFKDNVRVCAYGNIDELNSNIGLLVSMVDDEILKKDLEKIQENLLLSGGRLSQAEVDIEPLRDETKYIESVIDYLQTIVPELKNFILPGGTKLSATTHIVRAVCRRTERSVAELLNDEYGFINNNADLVVLQYLNRLSDYFFVLARFFNFNADGNEVIWKN